MTQTATRERPILYSGPMVLAILRGRKTHTRRVLKGAPESHVRSVRVGEGLNAGDYGAWFTCRGQQGLAVSEHNYSKFIACPYGRPGDRLWVRETWAPAKRAGDRQILYMADGRWGSPQASGSGVVWHGWTVGVTDKVRGDWQDLKGHWVGRDYFGPGRPSIHMPRWASRLTLEIDRIRVERLQEVTEEDAKAEGVESTHERAQGIADRITQWGIPCTLNASGLGADSYIKTFRQLWDQLNAKRGYGWNSNPWVWVVEFRRVPE